MINIIITANELYLEILGLPTDDALIDNAINYKKYSNLLFSKCVVDHVNHTKKITTMDLQALNKASKVAKTLGFHLVRRRSLQ
jgi:hypothetical protein